MSYASDNKRKHVVQCLQNENSGGGVRQESSVVVVGPAVCVRGVDTAGRGEFAAAQTKKV